MPLCLGMQVASDIPDTLVFSPSCAGRLRKLTASSENGWFPCFLPPLPKARFPQGAKLEASLKA